MTERLSQNSVARTIAAARERQAQRSSTSPSSGSSGGQNFTSRFVEVGSGAGGGVLVQDMTTGQISERFATPAPATVQTEVVRATAQRSSVSRGGGGGSSPSPNFTNTRGEPDFAPEPSSPRSGRTVVVTPSRDSMNRAVDSRLSSLSPLQVARDVGSGLSERNRERVQAAGAVFVSIFDRNSETGVRVNPVLAPEGSVRAAVANIFVPQSPVDVGLLALPFAGGKLVKAGRAAAASPAARAVAAPVKAASASVRSSAPVQAFARASDAASKVVLGSAPVRAVAGSSVGRAVQSVAGTNAGRWILGVGTVTAAGESVVQVTRGVARVTRGDVAGLTNREFESRFSDILGENLAPRTENRGLSSTLRNIATELTLFTGNKQEFENIARRQFSEQGFSGAELDSLVSESLRTRVITGAGEIAAQLNIARSTEAFGRREVSRAFALSKVVARDRVGGEIGRRVFFPIARAGSAEGFAAVLTQSRIRGERADGQSLAIGSGLGFVSAGILGTAIAATRPNRRGVSAALEFGANILDPFEKGGDLLQDATEASLRRLGVPNPRVPVITQTLSPAQSVTVGGFSDGGGSATFGADFAPSQIRSSVPVNQNPLTPSFPVQVPVTVNQQPRGGGGGRVPVPVNFDVIVGQPPVPVPVPNVINPVQPDPVVPVPVNVPVPVPVPVNFAIPVVPSVFNIPPPLPLSFGGGGASRGTGRGQRSYIDEVAAGAELSRILSTGAFPVPRPRRGARVKPRKVDKKERDRLNFVFGDFQAVGGGLL